MIVVSEILIQIKTSKMNNPYLSKDSPDELICIISKMIFSRNFPDF